MSIRVNDTLRASIEEHRRSMYGASADDLLEES